MNKGMGKAQQVRGHKRNKKSLNRKLNRNSSDLFKVSGKYAEWLDAHIKSQVDKIAETMKENA